MGRSFLGGSGLSSWVSKKETPWADWSAFDTRVSLPGRSWEDLFHTVDGCHAGGVVAWWPMAGHRG